MNLIHSVLILLFFATGSISFIAGVLVIMLRRTGWYFQTYLWVMLVAEAAIIALTAWAWSDLPLAAQILYVVLGVVGIYAIIRGFQARHKQAYRYTGWRLEFMDDLGFTLIFLLDAFIVIGFLSLNLPLWAVLAVAAIASFAGTKWLASEKDRYMIDRKRYNEKRLRKQGGNEQ